MSFTYQQKRKKNKLENPFKNTTLQKIAKFADSHHIQSSIGNSIISDWDQKYDHDLIGDWDQKWALWPLMWLMSLSSFQRKATQRG